MWCDVMVQPLSLACGYPVGPTPVYEEIIFRIFVTFLKYQLLIDSGVYFSNLNLFHRSVCLFLCQYYTILIPFGLHKFLKSGNVSSTTLFLFKKSLVILVYVQFHINA